ncbi:MAG: DUF3667 domain-containing protein [Rhodothermales bacterium]|nr:DUF3667 domain-containing protein [Rhodothermales bacterium]MBO6779902.1 DUF3667 domain-containing protein [Rhodothermales bacterium]
MRHCPNCDTRLEGAFCHTCGQPDTGRLTMRGFFQYAASRMFSMDRGFLLTLVGMFREPGDVPRRFVEGKRAWYTNPLSYWLIAAAVQLLALNLIEDGYLAYLQNQLRSQMETMGDMGAESLRVMPNSGTSRIRFRNSRPSCCAR